MSVQRIASRYAKSLIELANEQNSLEEVTQDMRNMQEYLKNRDLYLLFKSPVVSTDKKKQIFHTVFDGKLHKMTSAFLDILTTKGREGYMPEVATEYIKQYKRLKNISTVRLTTAVELSDEMVQAIHDKLKASGATDSNVEMVQVNLTPIFDSLLEELPKVDNEEERLMSLANTRARLRMTTLYYFAALQDYLVAGTGNKVEDFGVGFYTKYGDGGVDLSPIADLLKTEVFQLAAFLGVNEEILEAPPTDGLWGDSRTDEDQIGASYPELEWAMRMKDEGKTSANFKDREKEVFDIFMDYNTKNQHKMQPIPVCEIPEELKSSF